MKAKIKQKNAVARLTLEVVYDLLGETVAFKAGQYFFVTLLNAPYKDNNKDPTHHFSIVNSPNKNSILVNTTRLRDTAFKNSLREMPIGSDVEIGKIEGDFVLPEVVKKPLCFIALGIGITPFISMIRLIKEEKKDYTIKLIYSDSDKESMPYIPELRVYTKDNPHFSIDLTITKNPDWKGEKRHINGPFVREYIPDYKNYEYFISGPPVAVRTVASRVKKLGVVDSAIKTEDFSGY